MTKQDSFQNSLNRMRATYVYTLDREEVVGTYHTKDVSAILERLEVKEGLIGSVKEDLRDLQMALESSFDKDTLIAMVESTLHLLEGV